MPVKKNTIKKTSKKTITKKTVTKNKTRAKRTVRRGGAYPVAFSASNVDDSTLLSPHTQDHIVASTASSTMLPPPPIMPHTTMMPSPTTMMPSIGGEMTMDGGAKKRKKGKKRKAGPYALFVKKQFSKVKNNHPSWKATECMKEIAKMWKAQKK
jgi:hypothetical protein